jgi:energy-coupling factor transport system ATP-binding protein
MPEMCRIFPGLATGADAAERAHRDRKFDAAAYASLISDAGAREAPALIEARGLRFRYPGARTLALDNVDLVVRQGDFVAVLGANGSGKTTLTKLIAGVLRPSGGELLYKGASVSPGDIGYVYQNPDSQIFAETVFDEVAFALRMKKMAPDEIRVRVEAVLHSMGLSDKLRFDPFALPKGDRQKIACASILVAQPEVIVLDEPTTGLDFPSLTEMMALIAELNRQGKTILMITHSVRAAAAFSRTVLAMNEGKAIYYGPLREFFAQEERVREAHAERTDVMDLSMALNGNMILTAQEFQQCWPETEGKGS